MLYKLRTGDIVICEDTDNKRTNMYLLTYDYFNGYGLRCLTCGDFVGSYKDNKELMKSDLLNFLHAVAVIPKEIMVAKVNSKIQLNYPIKVHDIVDSDNEPGIQIEISHVVGCNLGE